MISLQTQSQFGQAELWGQYGGLAGLIIFGLFVLVVILIVSLFRPMLLRAIIAFDSFSIGLNSLADANTKLHLAWQVSAQGSADKLQRVADELSALKAEVRKGFDDAQAHRISNATDRASTIGALEGKIDALTARIEAIAKQNIQS